MQGIVRFLFAPLSLILATVDQVGKVLGQDYKLEEKFSGGIAGLVFDPVETEKKGEESIKAIDKSLTELKNKRAGYQLSIKAIDKAAADEAAETEAARLEKQLADEKKLTDDYLTEYEKRRKDAVNAKIITQKEIAALDEQERLRQEEANNKQFEAQKELLAKTTNFALLSIQKQQEASNASIQIDRLTSEQKIALAQQSADAILAVSDILGKETAAGKALAVSAALINTYLGITAGVKLGFPAAIPAVALAAATGFSAVKNILATKVPGTSSSGAGNISSPNLNAAAPISPAQPQAATTNLSSQTINAIGNQAVRAYVVENDVTSNQQRIAAIQQRARFG